MIYPVVVHRLVLAFVCHHAPRSALGCPLLGFAGSQSHSFRNCLASPLKTCCVPKRRTRQPVRAAQLYFSASFRKPAPRVCLPWVHMPPSISIAVPSGWNEVFPLHVSGPPRTKSNRHFLPR